MTLEHYIEVGKKRLRCGYTTGTCAAAAAQACGQALLAGGFPHSLRIDTPAGVAVVVEPEEMHRGTDAQGTPWASCGVRKDAGDDADATDDALVVVRVSLTGTPGTTIEGGAGVGRVTRAGLDQPVGAAAINSVPRAMIASELERVAREHGWHGGFAVEVSVPGGEEIASKTFNPRLGIEGGISILGTSGIVRPMSEEALIQTIRVDIKMQLSGGRSYLVLVPGNYGLDFLEDYEPEVLKRSVKYSNFLGEAIDAAVEFGAKGILLVGHIGKLVKLAAGIMNTHSRNADARMDILTAHAAVLGADQETAARLMDCITTDEALEILKEKGLLEPVMKRLMERMEFYVDHRSGKSLERGILTFSLEQGVLGESSDVRRLIACVKAEIEQTESEGTEKLAE